MGTDDAGIKDMLGNIMKQLADLQQQIWEGREENTDLRRELAETRMESAQVIHMERVRNQAGRERRPGAHTQQHGRF